MTPETLRELEALYERAKQAHRYPAMTLTVEAKDFAVAIWDNFPALLAELRRLEAERDELKAECERLRAQEEISSDVIAFYQGKYFELDAANAGLATEAERLRSGLRWYAHGNHYAGLDDWEEGADPECPNWLEPNDDGASGAMVENGHCARLVLSGQTPDWDGEPPMEHPCEPVMQAIAAFNKISNGEQT